MNKEKINLKKKLEEGGADTSELPFELIEVDEPIEQVMELEDYNDVIEATRKTILPQLEEACVEPINISCPYKTDILEGGIRYETSDWLIIYGIEILEGVGDFTMYFIYHRNESLRFHSEGCGNFISPKGIIVPELVDFIIESKDNQPLRYRLVGEGNNSPKMDAVPIERTYRRASADVESTRGKRC